VRLDPDDFSKRRPISDISHHFEHDAPLWFYILAEAEQEIFNAIEARQDHAAHQLGARLGPLAEPSWWRPSSA